MASYSFFLVQAGDSAEQPISQRDAGRFRKRKYEKIVKSMIILYEIHFSDTVTSIMPNVLLILYLCFQYVRFKRKTPGRERMYDGF